MLSVSLGSFLVRPFAKILLARQKKVSDRIIRTNFKSPKSVDLHLPTSAVTILEPQEQEIVEFYFVQECRTTDFEASKL